MDIYLKGREGRAIDVQSDDQSDSISTHESTFQQPHSGINCNYENELSHNFNLFCCVPSINSSDNFLALNLFVLAILSSNNDAF